MRGAPGKQAGWAGRRSGGPVRRVAAHSEKPEKEAHMAVYTEVSDDELRAFATLYDIGEVLSCKGIAEGVENSNYLVTTERGNFILTLYEKRVAPRDLPFFIALMEHLARQGVACPTPVRGRDGIALRELCGRPAAIVTFLAGMWPRRIQPHHCAALGRALAGLHLAGASFAMARPNDLSVAGWRRLFESCRCRADEVQPGLATELEAELGLLESAWPHELPTGVIHADLFPDNTFFRDGELSGLIDFYFACTDFLAYDLAICLNAWCFEADGSLNVTKARLLLDSYRRERPLASEECAALPLLARGAALRFLLTRLFDWLNQPAGALVRPKDPREYLRKLRFHRGITDPRGYGLDA
jgi:homoserine kinase type II